MKKLKGIKLDFTLLYNEIKFRYIIANNAFVTYVNEKTERLNDLPSIVTNKGTRYWRYNDENHRENSSPVTIYSNGDNYMAAKIDAVGYRSYYNLGERIRTKEI